MYYTQVSLLEAPPLLPVMTVETTTIRTELTMNWQCTTFLPSIGMFLIARVPSTRPNQGTSGFTFPPKRFHFEFFTCTNFTIIWTTLLTFQSQFSILPSKLDLQFYQSMWKLILNHSLITGRRLHFKKVWLHDVITKFNDYSWKGGQLKHFVSDDELDCLCDWHSPKNGSETNWLSIWPWQQNVFTVIILTLLIFKDAHYFTNASTNIVTFFFWIQIFQKLLNLFQIAIVKVEKTTLSFPVYYFRCLNHCWDRDFKVNIKLNLPITWSSSDVIS